MGQRLQSRRMRPLLLPLRSRHLVRGRQGAGRQGDNAPDESEGAHPIHPRGGDEGGHRHQAQHFRRRAVGDSRESGGD